MAPRRWSIHFLKDHDTWRFKHLRWTVTEVETLKDKVAKRLAEVKDETFATLLSEIKAEALIDTLANRLTDVELEILAETMARLYAEVLVKKLAYELRKVGVETVNETVGEISTDLGRDTCEHTSKGGG